MLMLLLLLPLPLSLLLFWFVPLTELFLLEDLLVIFAVGNCNLASLNDHQYEPLYKN